LSSFFSFISRIRAFNCILCCLDFSSSLSNLISNSVGHATGFGRENPRPGSEAMEPPARSAAALGDNEACDDDDDDDGGDADDDDEEAPNPPADEAESADPLLAAPFPEAPTSEAPFTFPAPFTSEAPPPGACIPFEKCGGVFIGFLDHMVCSKLSVPIRCLIFSQVCNACWTPGDEMNRGSRKQR
jgi:hypothetical protein